MASNPCPAYSQGTITFDIRTRINTPLFTAQGSAGEICLAITNNQLVYRITTQEQTALLEMEDIRNLTDNQWHSIAVTVDSTGTRVYIDGYQEFCGTTSAFFTDLGEDANYTLVENALITIREFAITERIAKPQEVLAQATTPTALIEFAAPYLSSYDVMQVGELTSGSIRVIFRVRGHGQAGTMFAAAGAGREAMSLAIDTTGITYRVLGKYGQWRVFHAQGAWDDGYWHDVVVTAAYGAIEIYVDGFRELHEPGQPFFADIDELNTVVIGQDTIGIRLFGEATQAMIYPTPLNDSQIKHLARIAPLSTQALFDRGYMGSSSYRIPSLIALPTGVVIAGADQRTSIPNDSPNHINFTIRRSLDNGATWLPVQTVIDSPGSGHSGASASDSVLVYDEQAHRVIVLIDRFPGNIGQPNCGYGLGTNTQGELLLHDEQGQIYTLHDDGTVSDSDQNITEYTVDTKGNVCINGQDGGNIWNAQGTNPNQTLLVEQTSFLEVLYSDDEGETWSEPRTINHMVKEPWMSFLGTSPGNGIVLHHGTHAGRIIMPVYFSGHNSMRFSTAVVYSDDHGITWKRSYSTNDNRMFKGSIIDPETFEDAEACLYECVPVEREDGSIIFFMRNQHPEGKVAVAISHDGGETWDAPYFHSQLPEIFSQPNAISLADAEHPNRLVFANASQLLPYRGAGVLRLSEDGGTTFSISRTFRPFHYVYQCMAWLANGNLGLLWEHEWQGLFFTQIPLQWFSNPRIE